MWQEYWSSVISLRCSCDKNKTIKSITAGLGCAEGCCSLGWAGWLRQWKDKPLLPRKSTHCLGWWLLCSSLSFLRENPWGQSLCSGSAKGSSEQKISPVRNHCWKEIPFLSLPLLLARDGPTLPRLHPALWIPLRLAFSPCLGLWTSHPCQAF